MKLPLEDIKVLDLSHALAGPFGSTMLADYGAQVIKIEPPGEGDIARAWGSPMTGGETAYFVSLHRNKKGIVLDLKHPQGKELFLRMVERCDVVLENYRVGTLQKLGIDYEVARKCNPGIIYCSISGYGQDGPYRDRAAREGAHRAGAVDRRLDDGRPAFPARHDAGKLPRERRGAGADGHGLQGAATLPDLSHQDARPCARGGQRETLAPVLPSDRPPRTGERPALRQQPGA